MMEKQTDSFDQAQEIIDLNLNFLEKLLLLDMDEMNKDALDYLLAQIRKTVGILGNLVVKHDRK